MRIHFTSRNADISESEKQRVEKKFGKFQRLFGRKAQEAHVILSRQRHLYEAEVTLRALNHTLVVSAARVDAYAAMLAALEKLEKQAVRNKHKLIDGRRPERQRGEPSPAAEAAVNPDAEAIEKAGGNSQARRPRVIRSSDVVDKPLTMEEALLRLEEQDRDQLTYRDAENGRLRVLLRRRDGDFELVEAG
jgi:putative sigma-54 modulation protein